MKNKARGKIEERSILKKPVPKPKQPPGKPGELFLHKRMNWWLGVGLVLPLVISQRAMEPVGPPRFMLLSLFLLAFLLYFYFFRAKQLAIAVSRPLTQVLGGLAASFLAIMVVTSFTAVNKQEALYST